MKINIEISRLANKYYFILTLSGRNIGFFDEYLPEYARITGKLTKEEKTELDKFNKWHSVLSEPEWKAFMKFNFDIKNNSNVVEDELPDEIKSVYKELESKFAKYWLFCQPELIKCKTKIPEIQEKYQKEINSCLNVLGSFFGQTPPEVMTVSLIYSPIDKMSGRFIDKNKFSQNVHEIEDKDEQRSWLLFMHESIHASFEGSNFKPWLREFVTKQPVRTALGSQMGPKNLLREVIATCFASSGYLLTIFNPKAEKLLKQRVIDAKAEFVGNPSKEYNYVSKRVSLAMQPEIQKYIETNRKIDEQFIQKVWNQIVEA